MGIVLSTFIFYSKTLVRHHHSFGAAHDLGTSHSVKAENTCSLELPLHVAHSLITQHYQVDFHPRASDVQERGLWFILSGRCSSQTAVAMMLVVVSGSLPIWSA